MTITFRDEFKPAFLNVAIRDILRAIEVHTGDKSGERWSPSQARCDVLNVSAWNSMSVNNTHEKQSYP